MTTLSITDLSKEESLYPAILQVSHDSELIKAKVAIFTDPAANENVSANIDLNVGM